MFGRLYKDRFDTTALIVALHAFFLLISSIIFFTFLFSLSLPTPSLPSYSNPGLLSRLYFPLSATVRAFVHSVRRFQQFLPSSTHIELFLPQRLIPVSCVFVWYVFCFFFAFHPNVRPTWASNPTTNSIGIRGYCCSGLDHHGDWLSIIDTTFSAIVVVVRILILFPPFCSTTAFGILIFLVY